MDDTINVTVDTPLNNEDDEKFIQGTDSADTITNRGDEVSISGGAGADSISNSGDHVTINGGAGVDSISNTGSNVTFQYTEGDGNDVIYGFNYTSTFQVMSGSVAKLTSDGKDLFLNFSDSGVITFKDGALLSKFNLVDSYEDAIDYGTVEVTGTGDADSIVNYFSNATINAGAGDDEIYNEGNNATITGGAGADSISNSGAYVIIAGGSGADSIVNTGSNVTFQYSEGDGNDFIDGFDETSTLKVLSGSVAKLTSDGKDLFLNFSDSGVITFKDGALLSEFNLVNASGNAIDYGAVEVNGTDDADNIVNHFNNAIINAGGGSDTILNYFTEVTITGDYTLAIEGATDGKLITAAETSAMSIWLTFPLTSNKSAPHLSRPT